MMCRPAEFVSARQEVFYATIERAPVPPVLITSIFGSVQIGRVR